MPTYDYVCTECGEQFQIFHAMSATPPARCGEAHRMAGKKTDETCDGAVQRLLTGGTGLIFKGSGFYITDYKKKGGEGGEAKSEGGDGGGESKGGDGTKEGAAASTGEGGKKAEGAAKSEGGGGGSSEAPTKSESGGSKSEAGAATSKSADTPKGLA